MSSNKAVAGRAKGKSFRVVAAIVVIVAVGSLIVWLKVVRGADDPTSNLATFVARRGPLTISVLESGTIHPREQITLRNEVEGRTSIVWLIPDGTRVQAGDLLVELDASTLKDLIIDQDILVQKADAAYINAKETLAVVENQAQSDIELAELTLEFAKQDLKQYQEGLYPNEKTAAQNDITLRQEELTRSQETLTWSQKLFDEKYISNTELQADKLAVTRSTNNLELAKNSRDLLQDFTYHRQIAQLTSDVKQAEMALERAQRKASADVVQAKADLKAKELELKRQKEKHQKTTDQLAKTKIYAPQEGMVVYATTSGSGGRRSPFDRREPMDIGVEVSERQDLITLPTAESMRAQVDIHETSLEKIRVGLPAVITVDALAGKKFLGRVGTIAPLPDARSMWMNPDLKIYPTDIYLEDNDNALRTGMSCKAEVIVAQYEDTVYVPVEAVLRVAGQPTVYVVEDGSYEARQVEIGLDDNNMIRIISGLDEGEVVLMTPPLQAATVQTGSRMEGGGLLDAIDVSETMRQRVNQKLEEANGTPAAGPGMPAEAAASPQQEGPGPGARGPGQGQQGGPGFPGASSQQMEQMRRRFENMSPEERQKEMERMRQRFENMSPEEREKMRQRFQGGGRRQGTGQRQGGDRRQGGGSRRGADDTRQGPAGPRGEERNQ
ncbi:MAG: DUF3106 domain-containing protein [Phycisphaerales bacterium]|nr:MAG: DUF3106 domain-containing protein [Phycisphaerales bacterium]